MNWSDAYLVLAALCAYLVLAALCATFIYVNWRRRLNLHDTIGALQLGIFWPIMLPIIIYSHLSKKELW